MSHAGRVDGKIIHCNDCGFAHLWPLPDADTVKAYYDNDQFYTGTNPHSPPGWFKKELAEHQAGYWYAYYDYLAGLLQPGKPVIDIGCGCGWLVDSLLGDGWYAWGVEPSLAARRFSPVQDRLYPSIDDLAMIHGIRGNITLVLTLEHILDPETFLRRDVLLHLDGRLVMVVPNEFNPLQNAIIGRETRLGADWWNNRFILADKNGNEYNPWFVCPVHINYFTPASLRRLLESVGLRIVHESGTFPTELPILFGYDHRGQPDRGKRLHEWRLRFERRFGINSFRLYRLLYRLFGIGREVIMVAER